MPAVLRVWLLRLAAWVEPARYLLEVVRHAASERRAFQIAVPHAASLLLVLQLDFSFRSFAKAAVRGFDPAASPFECVATSPATRAAPFASRRTPSHVGTGHIVVAEAHTRAFSEL